MKLAFIKKNFSIHGGAEKYMQTLMEKLKNRAEIHVIASKWIESPCIIFHKIKSISLISFLSVLSFNWNAQKKIKSLNPDCTISFERTTFQDIYRAGEGCHIEWLKLRKQIDPLWKRFTYFINPLHLALLYIEKKLFAGTKLIIANSNMVKSQIIQNYAVPEEKIKVIYNGVDLKKFSPQNKELYRTDIRKNLSIKEFSKVIIFVGTEFGRKGLGTLIKALSFVEDEHDIKLIIIGRGRVGKFRTLAKKFEVSDKVIFIGPQKDIQKFYAAADIFVLPTMYDPFSNATIEAMASGITVITTKNNGVSEIIENGEEGFVTINILDPLELAEKIKLCLNNSKTMGIKARIKAERFSIEKAEEEFLKTISDFRNNLSI
ncbi:MAG: glycosyltransferase family 4 protein [Nitrospiraceae bacterium]|nr:glycosyltransferase family 4 protein [Nitrospiraceae bacterium]